jgi:putative transposase
MIVPPAYFYRRANNSGQCDDEADLKRAQKLKDAAKNAQKWDENRHRKKALANIQERIANRRSDFAHKRSRELVNTYQVIVFEDLRL